MTVLHSAPATAHIKILNPAIDQKFVENAGAVFHPTWLDNMILSHSPSPISGRGESSTHFPFGLYSRAILPASCCWVNHTGLVFISTNSGS